MLNTVVGGKKKNTQKNKKNFCRHSFNILVESGEKWTKTHNRQMK